MKMKKYKKGIITILGLLILIALHVTIGLESSSDYITIILFPLFSGIYTAYITLMRDYYLKL